MTLLYHDEYERSLLARHITIEDARMMKLLNAGKFENHGRIFRLGQRAPAPVPQVVCSSSVDSCASISVRQMRAAIGEPSDSRDGEFPRHLQQRAEEKVRAVGKNSYTRDRRSWPLIIRVETGE